MNSFLACCIVPLFGLSFTTLAATRYVDLNSPSPTPPYTNWTTAATKIQDAVDTAVAGEEILVTNGVYRTGTRSVYGLSNRVAVTKPVTVRSVNGPAVTSIEGSGPMGAAAVRCVHLTSGAVLTGFTLTNGATQTYISGASPTNASAGGVWCESASALVSNCVLSGNSAGTDGGGAKSGTLNNCTITCNRSSLYGGGVSGSVLNGCALSANYAAQGGGGADGATLNNCTLMANSAFRGGGGAFDCFLNNCIIYYNTDSSLPVGLNYSFCTLNFCCTTPLPATGTGNTDAEPQLSSLSHLSASSPCIGRGSPAYTAGVDIDGEVWGNPPAIGCDEFRSGSIAGAVSVAILVPYTNLAVGFEIPLQAQIQGAVSDSRWDFGDGLVLSNRPSTTHAWTAPGAYQLELRAYNESYPTGIAALQTIQVVEQPLHYVALTSTNPIPPFSSWATAASNIQDAVDAVTVAGAMVLVTNGVYDSGARAVYGMSNRVALTKPVTLQSVNGPALTSIVGRRDPSTTNGPAAVRCVYLTNSAQLVGFTLTGGATQVLGDTDQVGSGGGAWCESISAIISDCVLTNNSASSWGAGAYAGTLYNCTLSGNSSGSFGGGAAYSVLSDCSLNSNWAATYGGGADYCTLNRCTLIGNSSTSAGGTANASSLNNCTLTGNWARSGGGAAFSALDHCVVSTNLASQYGGGVWGGSITNCTFMGNSASSGGGASGVTLDNCTLTGNSASQSGGGLWAGTILNCIVYYNTAPNGDNYTGGSFRHCCTTPLPTSTWSRRNFTNAPLFVDTNAWSDLRLRADSPCINSGNRVYAPGPTDLDGNPRVVGGTVDVGAYEFQSPRSAISYAWLQQYGLPIDGAADYLDPDFDGMNNWQEWVCLTVPTNELSALRMISAVPVGTNVNVTWQSSAGVTYFLDRTTNVASPFARTATNLPGTTPNALYTDTNAAALVPLFYRVGITPP